MTTPGATGSTMPGGGPAVRRACCAAPAIRPRSSRRSNACPRSSSYFDGPDLVIRAANAACRALYQRDDVIGLPLREAAPALGGQEIFELLDRVWAEQRPFNAVEWR